MTSRPRTPPAASRCCAAAAPSGVTTSATLVWSWPRSTRVPEVVEGASVFSVRSHSPLTLVESCDTPFRARRRRDAPRSGSTTVAAWPRVTGGPTIALWPIEQRRRRAPPPPRARVAAKVLAGGRTNSVAPSERTNSSSDAEATATTRSPAAAPNSTAYPPTAPGQAAACTRRGRTSCPGPSRSNPRRTVSPFIGIVAASAAFNPFGIVVTDLDGTTQYSALCSAPGAHRHDDRHHRIAGAPCGTFPDRVDGAGGLHPRDIRGLELAQRFGAVRALLHRRCRSD